MCFRPGAVSKPIECPNCQKKIPVVGGVKPKKCPHCGTSLEGSSQENTENKG